MKLFRLLRRLYWRAVLCEPEEKAEILSMRRHGFTDFSHSLRYVKRLDRYEQAFGPLEP